MNAICLYEGKALIWETTSAGLIGLKEMELVKGLHDE